MRAVIVPGADLSAPFYAGLEALLRPRGIEAMALEIAPSPRWDDRISALVVAARGAELIIGHSMGGLISLIAAAQLPDLRGLILLEPAIVPTRSVARWVARRYKRDVIDGARDRFDNWSGSFRRVADLTRYPPWAIELYLEQRRRGDPDIAGRLFEAIDTLYPLPFAQVHMPVLILRGAASGLASRVGAWSLSRRLARAEVQVIDGAAHWMVNERDQEIADAIGGWRHGLVG